MLKNHKMITIPSLISDIIRSAFDRIFIYKRQLLGPIVTRTIVHMRKPKQNNYSERPLSLN